MCIYIATTCCRDLKLCCIDCWRDCNPLVGLFIVFIGFPAGLLCGLGIGLPLLFFHLPFGSYNHSKAMWEHVCQVIHQGKDAYTGDQGRRPPRWYDCCEAALGEVYCCLTPLFAIFTLLMPIWMLFLMLIDTLGASFAAACAGCVQRPSEWWAAVSVHLRRLDRSLAEDALRPAGTAPLCTCLGESEVLPTSHMGLGAAPGGGSRPHASGYTQQAYPQPSVYPTAPPVHAPPQPARATNPWGQQPVAAQPAGTQQRPQPAPAAARQPGVGEVVANAAASAVAAGVSSLLQPNRRGPQTTPAVARAVPVSGGGPPVAQGVPVARPVN